MIWEKEQTLKCNYVFWGNVIVSNLNLKRRLNQTGIFHHSVALLNLPVFIETR